MTVPAADSPSDGLDAVIDTALNGKSVAARTRAMFGLRANGTPRARTAMETMLASDASALVRHEAAYLLGQLGNYDAEPSLATALRNTSEDAMVRHEAAEALGAIGDSRALPLLAQYATDANAPVEVRETCVMAQARIEWLANGAVGADPTAGKSAYTSVDPAPPAPGAVDELCATLCDSKLELYDRYRAMFGLRNTGGEEAVKALCKGLVEERNSALFRHEIAYVLGQMQHPAAIEALSESLSDLEEHAMVRHEAAEALGSIGTEVAMAVLEHFKEDDAAVVRESVAVALDIADYTNSKEFQYASTMQDSSA